MCRFVQDFIQAPYTSADEALVYVSCARDADKSVYLQMLR